MSTPLTPAQRAEIAEFRDLLIANNVDPNTSKTALQALFAQFLNTKKAGAGRPLATNRTDEAIDAKRAAKLAARKDRT